MKMIIKGWNTKYSSEDTVTLLKRGVYHDGSICLGIDSATTGEPLISAATACLSAYHEIPSEGNVFIKNYSENEGVLEALQTAGALGEVVRTIKTEYVEFQEVRLLVDLDT